MKKLRLRFSLVSIAIFMAFCINPVYAGVFQYRSINFCSWGAGGFDSEKVDEALAAIKSIGVNVVTLDWAVPFDPNTGARATKFDENTTSIREPSIEVIMQVAEKILALGMDVAFKPHIGHVQQGEGVQRSSFQLIANSIEFIKTDERGFEEGQSEDDIPT